MKFKSFFWSLLSVAALSLSVTACSDDDNNNVKPTPEPEPEPQPEVPAEAPQIDVRGIFRKESNMMSFNIKCMSQDAQSGMYYLGKTSEIDKDLESTTIEDLVKTGAKFDEMGHQGWQELMNSERGLDFGFGVASGLELGVSWGCIAEVSNGKASAIKRADCLADAKPVEGIELRVEGEAGDRNHEHTDTCISLFMSCTTQNAVSARYVFGGSIIIKGWLEEMTMEQFVEKQGRDLTELANTAIDELNGMNEGAPLWFEFNSKAGIQPSMAYTWILEAKDKDGNSALKSIEVTTTAGEVGDGPVVTFTGHVIDNPDKPGEQMYVFQAICKSQDAAAARMALMNKDSYDAMADQTIEQIINGLDQTKINVFNAEWLGILNQPDGIALNVPVPVQDGLVLSGLLEVVNAGGKTFRYADTAGGKK